MKPLERKFFRYCCKNLEHTDKENGNLWFRDNYTLLYLQLEFSEKYNAPLKQLRGYVNKWNLKGMTKNSGISIYNGWLEFDRPNCNIDQYIYAIPKRILSHNINLRKQVNKYWQKRAKYVQDSIYSVRGII